jgi:REP element-mobilizing transposase RayT
MARPWRIQFPNAVYHVTARGNNRQEIFLDDHDRRDFLDLLARASDRFHLHLFAFCLMNNHYHLFLRTPEPNLAPAMKWLNATYTNHFHRRHRRNGHLFQGRYQSILVADEAHWLHLSMYLHLNPVRARLVPEPGEYEWSSFRDYIRPRPRLGWVHPEEILSHYGPTPALRRRHYRRECLGWLGAEPDRWKQIQTEVILGAQDLIAEMIKKHRPRGDPGSVPSFLAACRASVDLEAELARVAKVYGVKVSALTRRTRNSPARPAAYFHLVEQAALPVSAVARRLGVVPSAVTHGVNKFKRLLKGDKELAQKMEMLNSKFKH